MVLKKSDSFVKTMLADTILALCRNTLSFEGEVLVEGLLGITLDNKEIFLVNINETIMKDGVKKSPTKRKGSEDISNSDHSSSQDSDSESGDQTKRKRRRKKKKRNQQDSPPKVDSENEEGTNQIEDNESRNEDSLLSNDRLKTEVTEDDKEGDDDEIVFVKEEPSDFDANTSCTFGSPGPGGGFGQLQELAMQLSGDMSSSINYNFPSMGTPTSTIPSSSLQPTPGGSSDQGLLSILDSSGSESTPQILLESTQDFNMEKYMDDHRQTCQETGKRSYLCGMCGKQFPIRNDLRRHLRIHTGNKPYKCDTCNQGFTRKSTLIYHKMAIHKEDHIQQASASTGRMPQAFSSIDQMQQALSSTGRMSEALSSTGRMSEALSSTGRMSEALSSTGRMSEALSSTGQMSEALSSTGRMSQALSSTGGMSQALSSTGQMPKSSDSPNQSGSSDPPTASHLCDLPRFELLGNHS